MENLTELQKELLQGLKMIPFHDRDLRSLTIWVNPNKRFTPDYTSSSIVLENLEILEQKGLVTREKKMLNTSPTSPKKEFELWSLKRDFNFETKELTDLEKQILIFIDQHTWNEDHPKRIKSEKYNKIGQAKIRWMKIRFSGIGGTKRFTESDVEFNRALIMLKKKRLITSRTKCQQFEGLTCTELGHNLSKKYILNMF